MSPEFEKIFCWGGSPQASCSCGRVHYASGGEFMDEGELERLQNLHKRSPKTYIPTTDDSVGIATINGASYVWDCPCEWDKRLENFLWSHRADIIAFYQARTQREMEAATKTAAALSEIKP